MLAYHIIFYLFLKIYLQREYLLKFYNVNN